MPGFRISQTVASVCALRSVQGNARTRRFILLFTQDDVLSSTMTNSVVPDELCSEHFLCQRFVLFGGAGTFGFTTS